mmetsp:Transcript_9701/g.16332  ORF Transcript_9701/g.16332 Transcript_9701/m.16332 type:complete len:139 (-) Transcript_9701:937-1353(-)|eukprot:CAMPEP_0168611368 /NCGR_PEP_ID=MMETSP0449_2-20121227/2322_1 /TAXON_ID=1082188 /ORGANISM="Strombidium rassoulzadegani, Strain ras09" /LENGTH=138 /DNA_ID=CAMNT_0008651813 /DNA_START=194 /DNA_END=610 /DNA_ORIENTATION=+
MQAKAEKILLRSALNLVFFSFFIQGGLALAVYAVIVGFYPEGQFKLFNTSILLAVGAAFLESLSEPFYTVMLFKMEFSTRAKAESVSIFVKSVMIYALVYRGGLDLLAYSAAQVAYSCVLFAMYFLISGREESKDLVK